MRRSWRGGRRCAAGPGWRSRPLSCRRRTPVPLARNVRRAQPGLAALDPRDSLRALERRLIAMKHIGPISSRGLLLSGGLAVALAAVVLVPYRVTAKAAEPLTSEPLAAK